LIYQDFDNEHIRNIANWIPGGAAEQIRPYLCPLQQPVPPGEKFQWTQVNSPSFNQFCHQSCSPIDQDSNLLKNHGFTTKNGEQPWIYQKKWRFPKMGVPQFAVSITKGSRGLTSCLASNGIRGCGILSVPTTIGWWLPPIDGLFRDGLPRQKWYILYILYIYIYAYSLYSWYDIIYGIWYMYSFYQCYMASELPAS
jgi:hypothetical protein